MTDFTKAPTGVPGPLQCTYINPTSWDWGPTITVQEKGRERELREANILPGKKGGMIIHHHPRKDHWGAKWGEPEHTDWQTTKCYINVRLGFHIEI